MISLFNWSLLNLLDHQSKINVNKNRVNLRIHQNEEYITWKKKLKLNHKFCTSAHFNVKCLLLKFDNKLLMMLIYYFKIKQLFNDP